MVSPSRRDTSRIDVARKVEDKGFPSFTLLWPRIEVATLLLGARDPNIAKIYLIYKTGFFQNRRAS
jgi:hypothetical protein